MTAKEFRENKGYGKGSNFTTLCVDGLMEAYANEKLNEASTTTKRFKQLIRNQELKKEIEQLKGKILKVSNVAADLKQKNIELGLTIGKLNKEIEATKTRQE